MVGGQPANSCVVRLMLQIYPMFQFIVSVCVYALYIIIEFCIYVEQCV